LPEIDHQTAAVFGSLVLFFCCYTVWSVTSKAANNEGTQLNTLDGGQKKNLYKVLEEPLLSEDPNQGNESLLLPDDVRH